MNKFLKSLSFLFFTFIAALVVYAQVDPAPLIPTAPPSSNEFMDFCKQVLTMHAAGALAISAVIIQGLMLAARQWLTGDRAKYLLVVVGALSLAAAVVNGLIQGQGLGTIVVNGAFLAMLQAWGFDVYSQFIKKDPAK